MRRSSPGLTRREKESLAESSFGICEDEMRLGAAGLKMSRACRFTALRCEELTKAGCGFGLKQGGTAFPSPL